MLQTRDIYLLTFSCFPMEEIHKPSGILVLSFNHLWISSHRLLEPQEAQICHFTMTSGMTHSRWGQTESKPKRQSCYVHCQAGLGLFPLSLSPSTKRLHRPVTGSKIHFSTSQLFSAGPTTTPRVRANVLVEWHLPPGAADKEALRTSIQLVWITNHSVPFPPIIVPYLYNSQDSLQRKSRLPEQALAQDRKTILQQGAMKTSPGRIRPARKREPELDFSSNSRSSCSNPQLRIKWWLTHPCILSLLGRFPPMHSVRQLL